MMDSADIKHMSRIFQVLEQAAELTLLDLKFQDQLRLWHEVGAEKQTKRLYLDIVHNIVSNDRCIFITSEGFLGCGSGDIVEGD